MFVHPSYPVTPSIYAQLIEQGFVEVAMKFMRRIALIALPVFR